MLLNPFIASSLQNLRFRNAKAQLSLFNRIIFTKLDGKSHQIPSVIKMYLNALFVKLKVL